MASDLIEKPLTPSGGCDALSPAGKVNALHCQWANFMHHVQSCRDRVGLTNV